MKFKDIALTFEKIESISSRLEITRILAELFTHATPEQAECIALLSLGQLRASYHGTQFNIADKMLIKAIALFLSIEQDIITAKVKQRGDIGLIFNDYQWQPTRNATLDEIYHALCDLEKISGTGSQTEKINALVGIFQSVDPLSAKFIARIIMAKLRLGFSDMTIIDALSWMQHADKSLRLPLEDAYNRCADIGLIAKTLKTGGIEAIKDMHITVGIPIIPAAAERLATAQAIFEKIGDCFAEPKLDGFRLQVHLDKTDEKNPKIHFFSRNLQDMSPMFPDLKDALVQLDVKNLIAEGEAICYNKETQEFLPFQETIKRKRKHGIDQATTDLPLQLFLFDILYCNDQEYLTTAYTKRHQKLQELFVGMKSPLLLVNEYKKITDATMLEDYFFQTVSSGLEGLVVKRPDAVYQPGKRNFNWIKLKRQEEGHLEDTIDCVILGYYKGEGKRAHFGIGAFLVGVLNTNEDLFQTVAKIGTGLSDDEWKHLKKECDSWATANQPNNIVCAKELAPDIWTTPHIVCRIRADEITLSPLHSAGKTAENLGFALRFPRFMDYRPDKSPQEATTTHEVKRLYEDQFVK